MVEILAVILFDDRQLKSNSLSCLLPTIPQFVYQQQEFNKHVYKIAAWIYTLQMAVDNEPFFVYRESVDIPSTVESSGSWVQLRTLD